MELWQLTERKLHCRKPIMRFSSWLSSAKEIIDQKRIKVPAQHGEYFNRIVISLVLMSMKELHSDQN